MLSEVIESNSHIKGTIFFRNHTKMNISDFYEKQNHYASRKDAIQKLGVLRFEAMSSLATNTIDSGLLLIRPPLAFKEILISMFKNEISREVWFQLREFPLSPLAIRFLFGLGNG